MTLEVDQELREGPGPGIARALADTASTLLLGEDKRVEEHGTRCGTYGVEAVAERALKVFEVRHWKPLSETIRPRFAP